MRAWMWLALVLPGVAEADTIVATSHVTAVTVYPQGALVTREVAFDAAAGAHDLLITDLPVETEAQGLRVTSADADLGAFALRTDRLPPRGEDGSPRVVAAKAAVKEAEAAERAAQAAVDAIQAQVEGFEAQIKFLTGVKLDGVAKPEEVQAMAATIGAQVLAARQAALAAAKGLAEAEDGVTKAEEAVTAANDALAAELQRDEDYAALSVAVVAKGGQGHVTVTHYIADAAWAPVYDMVLDRKAGKLAVERGVLVSQASGEDWAGVDLTLSTARPSDRAEPSRLYPWLRSVVDPVPEEKMADDGNYGAVSEPVMAPEAVAAAGAVGGIIGAAMYYQGDTVVYHYPTAVDVATGVENLRLALDELAFSPKVFAQAVPRSDETAFLVASLTNEAQEIMLPGTAYLYRDGSLVGSTELVALSPGQEVDLGFGAIDGIRLKRDMPQRAAGDRGVFTSSTQIEEKAVLQVENLTGEAWPMRLLDQVPYSEQEELEITWQADPAVTEADFDGQRGILMWEFELAAGEKKEIKLDSLIRWPEGKVLQ